MAPPKKSWGARVVAVLLLALASLSLLVSAGKSWGQAKIPHVGVLTFISTTDDPTVRLWMGPFRRKLAEQGWIEGKSVAFEYRSALGDPSRLAEVMAELVQLKVDVIWASGAPLVRAAHAATRSIPIVAVDFTTDPIAEGYVESYGRPGGNLTGVFLDAPEFAGKWFQLLKTMVPGLSRVGVLWDPSPGAAHMQAVQAAARSFGVQLEVIEVHKLDDLDKAFSAFRAKPQALIILPSPMTYAQSARLAKLAMRHRLLAMSMAHAFAEAGGAVSYGPDLTSTNERIAVFVGKILGGMKPAELPVERPTRIQLVVNLKTAKALGRRIPDSVRARADELIR
jgi:putative ABC transport system substrate-binding protein